MADVALSKGLRNRRFFSWLAVLLTFGLFFVLPLLGHWNPHIRDALQGSRLPTEQIWSSGDLSDAHKDLEQRCTNCHAEMFAGVSDISCLQCHRQTKAHIRPTLAKKIASKRQDCGSCHQEHNGDQSLIPKAQVTCTSCHGDFDQANLFNLNVITDFSYQHPEFHPRLRVATADSVVWKRVNLAHPSARHTVGLHFAHAVHLNDGGIASPDGKEQLTCASCHSYDRSAEYFSAIRMEEHCVRCHRLNFELQEPSRYVAHVAPAQIQEELLEYYSLIALQGGHPTMGNRDDISPKIVHRPGSEPHVLTNRERESAFAWAENKARTILEELLFVRSCHLCHTLISDPTNQVDLVSIEPVITETEWFRNSRFRHRQHASTDCQECHAAAESNRSDDILIPGIQTCRQCHGAEIAENRSSSNCIICHRFHHGEQRYQHNAMTQESDFSFSLD